MHSSQAPEGGAPAALQKLPCGGHQARAHTPLCTSCLRTFGFPFCLFLTLFLSLTEALHSLKFIWICPHDLHESWTLTREPSFKLKDLILIRKKTCECSAQPRTEPQWGPKRPLCATSIFLHGSVYRDRRREAPRKRTGFYLLGLKPCILPGGAVLVAPVGRALESHASIHFLNEMARSMPSPAWHPTVHCTISLHPRTFLPYGLEACYSCNSFCSSTCMDGSRYFLDSNRSMLHWDKLAKGYWILRS